ncbi:MAG: DUF3110 domain-containing protein [Candidatus Nanopelagicaceae bacterium]
MFILTLLNKIEGVFSVVTEDGDQIIPMFESEDDAERYNDMMKIETSSPMLQIVELEDELIINACEERYQKYAIITKDDFLIPPKDLE